MSQQVTLGDDLLINESEAGAPDETATQVALSSTSLAKTLTESPTSSIVRSRLRVRVHEADPIFVDAGEFRNRSRKAQTLDAPEPSQRGPQSINALIQYCEDPKTCRHVTICRYFGEKVDRSDSQRLCQRFCDVCKDPKRTLARFARLSSMGVVSSQSQRLHSEIDAEGVPEPDQGEEPAIATTANVVNAVEGQPLDTDEALCEDDDDGEEEMGSLPRLPVRQDRDVKQVSSGFDSDSDVPSVGPDPVGVARPSDKSLGKRKATDERIFGDDAGDDDLPDAWDVVQKTAEVPRKAARPARGSDVFKKPALPVRKADSVASAPRIVLQPQGGLSGACLPVFSYSRTGSA